MQNLFSRLVIFFAGLVFLALLALNIGNHVYYMGSLGSILYHFAIPSLLALATFASLKLPPPARLSLAMCLVSVAIGLYAAELYLTLRHENRPGQTTEGEGGAFDKRTKLEVIMDLRKDGVDAYPVMRAKSMLIEDASGAMVTALKVNGEDFLPVASVPEKTVVSCNEDGHRLVYESDRHGFHNPPDAWDKPPHIALIGDSFTHGSCVSSDSNTAAWLRKRFDGVLNLGVSGFGPLAELLTFREYVQPLKPETVLWFFYEGNDFTKDLPVEKRTPLLMKYYQDDGFSQGLIERAGDISTHLKAYLDERMIEAINRFDEPNEWLMDFLELFHLREMLGLGPMALGVHVQELEDNLGLFGGVLAKVKRAVNAWGGKMYFVYLPESSRYFAAERDNAIREYFRGKVLQAVAEQGIKAIDVHTALADHPDPRTLYQYPGSHFNEQGYKVTAETVIKALEKR